MRANDPEQGRAATGEFILVHRFMWADLGLSGTTRDVFARIYGFCREGGRFFESRSATARFLGISARSVTRAINELSDCGLIVYTGEHTSPTGDITRCYRVSDEAIAAACAGEGEHAPPDKNSPPDSVSGDMRVNPDGSSGDPVTGCHPIRKRERK